MTPTKAERADWLGLARSVAKRIDARLRALREAKRTARAIVKKLRETPVSGGP